MTDLPDSRVTLTARDLWLNLLSTAAFVALVWVTGDWWLVGAAVAIHAVAFVYYVARLHRESAQRLVHVPEGAVPCARCEDRPRTSAGFCAPCGGLLVTSPLPLDHPASRLVRTFETEDVASIVPSVAPTVTTISVEGGVSTYSRARWLRSVRSSFRSSGRRSGAVLAAHLDPMNREYVWVLVHDRATGRRLVPAIDAIFLMRYWLPHGQVAEVRFYPALGPTGLV
ncbi:MAG: hypothetical protein Q7T55_01250 [Solirubrobacteraceae bacterium]|nr:hypothetical protein [Solirubrobacteraceae bacterium]